MVSMLDLGDMQGWTDAFPTGLYFMSSHYSHAEGQLVSSNLPLPCVDSFGVQYNIQNAIATLAYGESIRVGEPGHQQCHPAASAVWACSCS